MTRLTATAVHESNLTHRVISLARLRLMSVIIAIYNYQIGNLDSRNIGSVQEFVEVQ